MDRYMVITPHEESECNAVVGQVINAGFQAHVDWGCKDNDHTGWAIVEADSHEQAMMFVPAILRPKARVVRIVKFGMSKLQH